MTFGAKTREKSSASSWQTSSCYQGDGILRVNNISSMTTVIFKIILKQDVCKTETTLCQNKITIGLHGKYVDMLQK